MDEWIPPRVTCPFRLCGAFPRVINGGTPDSRIIERHTLPPLYRGAGVGDCPGSLQRYPITDRTRSVLAELEKAYPEHRGDPATGRIDPPFTGPRMTQPFPVTGRGKPKMSPKDPGWQVGGRQDEDVRPQTEDVRGRIPPTTEGYSMGRTVATANELVGMIHAAGAQGAEAAASIYAAKEACARATGLYAEVSSDSPTMQSAIGAMNQAVEKLSQAIHAINVAAEHGNTYAQRLFM